MAYWKYMEHWEDWNRAVQVLCTSIKIFDFYCFFVLFFHVYTHTYISKLIQQTVATMT